ncbi:MAG: S4 domain-containing protein [Candidatus Woesearchaeota archaeon]|nr:S4 domain-containing protein [Candidatus Woesearchaeota archaeon]
MKRHLKRYAAPAAWHIQRKTTMFVAKPRSGPHPIATSMPLSLWLLQLGFAKTQKEARFILQTKKILIDGKRAKRADLAVGLFDVLNIPELKLTYLVQLNTKGRLYLMPSTANEKICKIVGKKTMAKEYQLSLSGGRTARVTDNNYHVHDSVTLSLTDHAITKYLPLKSGANVALISGKHVGNTGIIERIDGQKVWCKINENIIETRKKLVCVIP